MLTRVLQAVRLAKRRGRLDDDIEKELAFHLQMEIDERVRRGMTRDEARRTALRDFGGVGRVREEVRDVRGANFWGVDLKAGRAQYGLRLLDAIARVHARRRSHARPGHWRQRRRCSPS